jgi:hypothetical protein
LSDWQNLLAAALVAVSAAYLAGRGWQALTRRKAGGCGSCANCPDQRDSTEPQVVSLEINRAHENRAAKPN